MKSYVIISSSIQYRVIIKLQQLINNHHLYRKL